MNPSWRDLYEGHFEIEEGIKEYIEDAAKLGYNEEDALETLKWARRRYNDDVYLLSLERIRKSIKEDYKRRHYFR